MKRIMICLLTFAIIFTNTVFAYSENCVGSIDILIDSQLNNGEVSVKLNLSCIEDENIDLCNIQTELEFNNNYLKYKGFSIDDNSLSGLSANQLKSDASIIRIVWFGDTFRLSDNGNFITLKFEPFNNACNNTAPFSIDSRHCVITGPDYKNYILNQTVYKSEIMFTHLGETDVPMKAPTPIDYGTKAGRYCTVCKKWISGGQTINRLSLGTPSFSLTGDKGKFTVKYKCGKNANAVVISYCELGSKKWKEKIVYVKNGSVTLKNLPNSAFNVKLCSLYRSGKSSVRGKFTSAKSVSTLAVPKLKLTTSKAKVKVSCNKVSGATGYQICFRKNGKGKWTVKSYSSKKGIAKTFQFGSKQKYEFRVRSFVTKSGHKVYTKYTKSKTVKTK